MAGGAAADLGRAAGVAGGAALVRRHRDGDAWPFLADAVGGDLGRKLAGGDDAHGAPPGYLSAAAVGDAVPRRVRGVARPALCLGGAPRTPQTRFLLAWIVPSWLVFELVPTKLPHYVLPLYPALCLLASGWAMSGGGVRWRWLSAVSALLFLLAAGVFGIGAAALPAAIGVGDAARLLLGGPGLLAAAAVAVCVLRAGRDQRRAVWSGLLAAPLLWWAILAIELPNLSPLWVSARVSAWLHTRPVSGFAAVGYAEPSLMFAAGTGTRWLDAAAAARFLMAAGGRVVAVAGPQVGRFLIAAEEGAPRQASPTAFATVRGFDYSTGKPVALTLFERR